MDGSIKTRATFFCQSIVRNNIYRIVQLLNIIDTDIRFIHESSPRR